MFNPSSNIPLTSLLTIGALSLGLAGAPAHAATILYQEDFEGLTPNQQLDGQDQWSVRDADNFDVQIVTGPSDGVTTSQVVRQATEDEGYSQIWDQSFAGVPAGVHKLVFQFDLHFEYGYRSGHTRMAKFGLADSTDFASGPAVGYLNAWNIRGADFGTSQNAKGADGSSLSPQAGHWYRVRSQWDLTANGGSGTATLAIEDLTAGDTTFTPLYFDPDGDGVYSAPTADLQLKRLDGPFVTAILRLDGTAAYADNLSITAVPEPGSLALLGLGGILILRRKCRRSRR